ncbi:MAG: hypothetical protein AB7L92_03615 [Alphaproteobacteria bacterium]
MKKAILAGIALMLLTGCSNKIQDLKSPCVGDKGSPCDRRPVNDGWEKA